MRYFDKICTIFSTTASLFAKVKSVKFSTDAHARNSTYKKILAPSSFNLHSLKWTINNIEERISKKRIFPFLTRQKMAEGKKNYEKV